MLRRGAASGKSFHSFEVSGRLRERRTTLLNGRSEISPVWLNRWWDPAVENQAADRVYRIGQQRDAQVHKFLCVGTMEARIDKLIDGKK
jgi:hypothetical protein